MQSFPEAEVCLCFIGAYYANLTHNSFTLSLFLPPLNHPFFATGRLGLKHDIQCPLISFWYIAIFSGHTCSTVNSNISQKATGFLASPQVGSLCCSML